MKFSPKSEAIAYRAWVEAEKHGWDITVPELAERLGLRKNVVLRIVSLKGWLNRFRATRRDTGHSPGFGVSRDDITQQGIGL